MTCNQLIVLASIYRGTVIPSSGTINSDLNFLATQRLIIDDRRDRTIDDTKDITMTLRGKKRLEAALELISS